MGIDTVAVYSEPDAHAAFVHEADLAVPLGGAAPADSYLRGDAVLQAAISTGADAIHPGYGFLSENADFARAVTDAGLTWVGPTPEAIDAMGSKIEAKRRMEGAGVPLLPSVELTGLDSGAATAAAAGVGYPLLIKASAGGGGRGMRVVESEDDLTEAIDAATREAESAFGDGTVYAERFVSPSKHVEVQIFGDSTGSVVHFGERECSVQRRHQKVIEEAPSPSIDDSTRDALHAAAVAAGKAIGYQNAGTVEFLLDPEGGFYFLEVNTRLQVEHPVTEAVHDVDLVRLQLEVSAGGEVPAQHSIVAAQGHSVEARIYAEDPTSGYLPSIGDVLEFEVPAGVRVDAAFNSTGVVGPDYDAMIAKVISHAATRDEAVRVLAKALRGTRLVGIQNNIGLLVRALEHPDFADGGDTEMLERADPAALGRPLVEGSDRAAALLAGALALQSGRRTTSAVTPGVSSGFRNVTTSPQTATFDVAGDLHAVSYRFSRRALTTAAVDGDAINAVVVEADADHVELVADGVRRSYHVTTARDQVIVSSPLGVLVATKMRRFVEPRSDLASGSLVAAMPGTVRAVEVAEGDTVESGQTVVVMEAMKMELAVEAPASGTVTAVHVSPGDAIDAGAPLVIIE
jgi:acetyl/propionyl-CoA carboxylase alpha subunit